MKRWLFIACFLLLVGCAGTVSVTLLEPSTSSNSSRPLLRLATTTSTADTGLLDAILPDFVQQYNAEVQVIAVGTGQALKLGENGDVDVVLVHARAREDEFVAQGYGINRRDIMYNDFVIVGAIDDPAHVGEATSAADAFARIAVAEASFASRGDDSGTYTKEQSIWATTGIAPTSDLPWYNSLGQGMGETLIAANQMDAYTLSDRGTYLAMQESLPHLRIVFGGDTIEQNLDLNLRNLYGVIAVNPLQHTGIEADLAHAFIEWLASAQTQARIGEFGLDQYGQALFHPASN